MNNTINGRTPEEIKKGLECCSVDGLSCSNCSYCVSCDADIHALERDALAYIQQLEDHFRDLTKKVEQLERERDAAVADMTELMQLAQFCRHCKHLTDDGECTFDFATNKDEPWCWQWRGVQPEPPKEET